jgi:hypothetical protein
MLSPELVAEIRRRLDTHSQRKIAAMLGVSRGTVATVALGRWREHAADDAAEPTGPPARCAGCGGMVYMPCLLCRLRNERPRTTARRRTPDDYASPRLDLRPEHRQRYEEVRARRQTSTKPECVQS